MAFKLIEAAQAHWRAVALVHNGGTSKHGKLVERPTRTSRAQAAAQRRSLIHKS